jgi:hypothetical protein
MKHPKITKCLLAILIAEILLVCYLMFIDLLEYMINTDSPIQEIIKHREIKLDTLNQK